jgi:hypothetical protein
MQLITDKLSDVVFISASVESLQSDVELITQFLDHANGCGLESLDSASGKLIEKGLASRYPEHFVAGAGLEGITDLVAKLKKGIEGLKKMARGKAKPFLEKQISVASADIEKTYANKAWLDERGSTGKDVTVGELSKAIGSFKDFSGLISAVEAVKKTLGDAFDAHCKQTADYIKKADVVINNAPKLRGKSDDELFEYAKEQIAIFKPLRDALKTTMPEIKGGNTTTISTITTEQAKQLGDLMLDLLDFGGICEEKAEDLRMAGGGQDIFEDLELGEVPAEEALGDLQWSYLYWESATHYNSELADKIASFTFTIIQKLEKVIISALK